MAPEKTVCRRRSNSQNQIWNKGQAQNWEKTLTRLYIVTALVTVTLGDSQAEIKIPRRNNNFRYADDITLMAENKEGLKSFLMKVKEESEIAGLKLNIQKTNMMVSSPIPSCK